MPHFQYLRNLDPFLDSENDWYMPSIELFKQYIEHNEQNIIDIYYNKGGMMRDWETRDNEEITDFEAQQKVLDLLDWYWNYEPKYRKKNIFIKLTRFLDKKILSKIIFITL